jgi:hypothetical protein
MARVEFSFQRQPFLRGNGRLIEVDCWRERAGRTIAVWFGSFELLISIATHSAQREETDDYPKTITSPGDLDESA